MTIRITKSAIVILFKFKARHSSCLTPKSLIKIELSSKNGLYNSKSSSGLIRSYLRKTFLVFTTPTVGFEVTRLSKRNYILTYLRKAKQKLEPIDSSSKRLKRRSRIEIPKKSRIDELEILSKKATTTLSIIFSL